LNEKKYVGFAVIFAAIFTSETDGNTVTSTLSQKYKLFTSRLAFNDVNDMMCI